MKSEDEYEKEVGGISDVLEALRVCEEALTYYPDSCYLLFSRASFLDFLGHKKEALQAFKELDDPRDEELIYLRMGGIYFDLKDYENAFLYYKKTEEVIKRYPSNVTLFIRFDPASGKEEVLHLKFGPVLIDAILGKASALVELHSYPEALSEIDALPDYDEDVKIRWMLWRIYIQKGDILIKLDNKEEAFSNYTLALDLLDKAIMQSPEECAFPIEKAYLLLQMGSMDDARKSYLKAKEIEPGIHEKELERLL